MVDDGRWRSALTGLALGCIGCAGHVEVQLTLEGPDMVRVHRLGLVAGPDAVLSDGSRPEGVVWDVAAPEVARVRAGAVEAVAPGTTQVVGTWEDQEVAWTLVVDPSLALDFVQPPANVAVGEARPVLVHGNGEPLDAQLLRWETSAPTILRVEPGRVVGLSAGVAYVTVERHGSRAMVQIDVVEP